MKKYKGFIKKSRSLDAVALSQMVDAAAAGFFYYTPEQLGIAVPVYAGIRIAINIWQARLRYKTTGPVGEK